MPEPVDAASPKVEIYTDGGCEPNPGCGGYGVVLIHPRKRAEASGGFRLTTNNRMEILAAIKGLEMLRRPCKVTLYTDSQYLRKGITEWMCDWERRAWKTASNEPVKNRDLWEKLDTLAAQHDIVWKWVKGHAGHEQNERVDRLAAVGRSEYQ